MNSYQLIRALAQSAELQYNCARIKKTDLRWHRLGTSSMRFYLDVPLVAGYVLMAIPACLGMLQLAASRSGYVGLCLFTDAPKSSTRIALGLILGSVVLYAIFAPEIHTPGPAGTEITEMFLACALLATAVTLMGAHWRLRRQRALRVRGEPVDLEEARAFLIAPGNGHTASQTRAVSTVIVCCDPIGYVTLPPSLLDELCAAGIKVLLLDTRAEAGVDAPLSRSSLLGVLSLALTYVREDERVGLLGLGLGGDAVLTAAMGSARVAAAMAVSPVLTTPTPQGDAGPGVHWLQELSVLQSWRWRRQWPVYQQSITDLYDTVTASGSSSRAFSILYSDEAVLTTRNLPNLQRIPMPNKRHFTLLEEPVSRHRLIQWFQTELG